MAEAGALLFAWLATAWLHGLALCAAVWAVERLGWLKGLALRETAWRAVLLAPLLSAALQVFALGGSPTAAQAVTPPVAPLRAAPAPPVETVTPGPATTVSTPAAPTAAASMDLRPLVAPIARQAPGVLGWAWISWLALVGAGVGLQRLRLRRYRLALAAVTDEATRAMAAGLCGEAGVVGLRLSEDPGITSPIALAPATVVVPTWAVGAFSPRQLSALLAHEVRHLARRDPQWRAIGAFACAALLAPHGRLVLKRLELLAEHACDGWSARRTGDGTPLAECIAACLERGLAARTPGLAAAMAQKDSPLLERVRRLLDREAEVQEPESWRERILIIGALGAAAVALPGFAVGHVQPARLVVAPAMPAAAASVAAVAQSPEPVQAPVATAPAAPARRAPAPIAPARPVPPVPPTEGERAALAALAEVRAEAALAFRPALPAVPAMPATPAPPAVPNLAPAPAPPARPAAPAALPDLPVPPAPVTPPTSPY